MDKAKKTPWGCPACDKHNVAQRTICSNTKCRLPRPIARSDMFSSTTKPNNVIKETTTTTSIPKDQDNLCVICIDSPSTHLFVDCGHLALCVECSKIKYEECPLCRTVVTRNPIVLYRS